MKGGREHKRYIAILRKYRGKKNGVFGAWGLDDLHLFKLVRDKKWRKVFRRPRDGYHDETSAD